MIWKNIFLNYSKQLIYQAEEADLVFELIIASKGVVI